MTILENRKEATLYFVHVYWSPDESKVAVLGTGFNIWNCAWDVTANRPIPFTAIKADFGRSIKSAYGLAGDRDPIAWAASSDAQAAFFRLHPEIKLSYR
jgi:hypothetical protein